MAEIGSEGEEALLDTVLIGGKNYWLGLTDTEEQGTWLWSESGEAPGYLNWAQGQPNNHGDEDCEFKTNERLHEGWHDLSCLHNNGFFVDIHALCEVNPQQ